MHPGRAAKNYQWEYSVAAATSTISADGGHNKWNNKESDFIELREQQRRRMRRIITILGICRFLVTYAFQQCVTLAYSCQRRTSCSFTLWNLGLCSRADEKRSVNRSINKTKKKKAPKILPRKMSESQNLDQQPQGRDFCSRVLNNQ